MSWLSKSLNSSLGKKLLVAATGLFLCTFLVVHLIGNLQLLKHDSGDAFNVYAKFMTSNPLIKTTSYLLYISILVHAIYGLVLLGLKNNKARPVAYHTTNNSSVWTSRSMGILGTVILVFIVGHMGTFWREYHFEQGFPTTTIEGVVYKNLYVDVQDAFKVWWIVVLYVFSMAALAFHLSHGFASGFQTLGLNHPKYTPFVKVFGAVFAYLIPAAFALIPVWMFLN